MCSYSSTSGGIAFCIRVSNELFDGYGDFYKQNWQNSLFFTGQLDAIYPV
jgi:hypothetical protein